MDVGQRQVSSDWLVGIRCGGGEDYTNGRIQPSENNRLLMQLIANRLGKATTNTSEGLSHGS